MAKPKKELVARSIRYEERCDPDLKILANRDNRSVNQYVVWLMKKDMREPENVRYIKRIKREMAKEQGA